MQLSDAKQAKKGRISRQANGAKIKRGRPPNKAVLSIMRKDGCSTRTAFRKLKKRVERRRTEWDKLVARTAKKQFCEIIKPSDVWNFNPVYYPRIDLDASHGYLPGEVYCNALFHYGPGPGGLVVAPMAGSGMIHHVLLDRAIWAKGRQPPLDGVELRMSDLTPRGPHKALIKPWNILDGFPPMERAPDYVIADVPYFGIVRHQYSRRTDDIANMDEANWTEAMRRFARCCAEVRAKRCTIVVSGSHVNHTALRIAPCGEIVREAWRDAGYRLLQPCWATRAIQQHPRMPRWNNIARELRLPMSGMAEVLTFDLA